MPITNSKWNSLVNFKSALPFMKIAVVGDDAKAKLLEIASKQICPTP